MLEAREPACEPRHRRRDDEGGGLVALDVVALEAGALLVLADCRQHVAEGRAQQPQQQEEDAEGDRCAESVVGPAVAQLDRPEGAAREAAARSAERRVGKEWVRTGRSRCEPYDEKQTKNRKR